MVQDPGNRRVVANDRRNRKRRRRAPWHVGSSAAQVWSRLSWQPHGISKRSRSESRMQSASDAMAFSTFDGRSPSRSTRSRLFSRRVRSSLGSRSLPVSPFRWVRLRSRQQATLEALSVRSVRTRSREGRLERQTLALLGHRKWRRAARVRTSVGEASRIARRGTRMTRRVVWLAVVKARGLAVTVGRRVVVDLDVRTIDGVTIEGVKRRRGRRRPNPFSL